MKTIQDQIKILDEIYVAGDPEKTYTNLVETLRVLILRLRHLENIN